MTIIEVICALVQDAPVGVVVTDSNLTRPGPAILYANQAFERLTGRSQAEMLGISPRFMQGRETRRPVLDSFAHALGAGERFHGFLTNYRGDGTKYDVEIDCRPLRNAEGKIEHFISFEREVARRRGRPFSDGTKRFDPIDVSNEILTDGLLQLSIFKVIEKQIA